MRERELDVHKASICIAVHVRRFFERLERACVQYGTGTAYPYRGVGFRTTPAPFWIA